MHVLPTLFPNKASILRTAGSYIIGAEYYVDKSVPQDFILIAGCLY